MSKINDAIAIISALGYPRAQQNERSALSLLALVQLQESGTWQSLQNPLLGVRAILDFCRNFYFKPYAENSRESFRKNSLHQFVSGGLALQNPDEPSRSVNSPKWCYQISPEAKLLLETYGTPSWEGTLAVYLSGVETLAARYKAARDFELVTSRLPNDALLQLSPGRHSELIKAIIEQFAPRFAPGSKVLYVGDTGNKGIIHDEQFLKTLGITIEERGKMPDALLYSESKNWLYLIECVTNVGPVDGKRHAELIDLFGHSSAAIVFVTAFPSREVMARFLPALAWGTEVWIADNPDHLIHFNGDRFMGPYSS